jgi:8-oxo-dGTP pyrophosphatase MutT (NUDIX family)
MAARQVDSPGAATASLGGAGYYVRVRMPIQWNLATVTERLRARLPLRLPGLPAQQRMAPRPRRGWRPGELPETAKPAAALLLLYEHDGEAALVLTLRTSHLPTHAGQVSLPGGAVDPGESLVEAALREAEEEVGIRRSHVRILGSLTPLHIPVSNYVLHPFIGSTADRPDFVPAQFEVAGVTEVSLRTLASPATWRLTTWHSEGRDFDVPYFRVGGLQVWGATAMVLSEFLALLDVEPVAQRGDEDHAPVQ